MSGKSIAIAGGGPAGAALATLCARRGHQVTVFDRHEEPQSLVGESLLPMGNRVLEILGMKMDGFMEKSGALFGRGTDRVRFDFSQAERPEWTSTHQVSRKEFDARLRNLAREAGADFRFADQKSPPTGFDWCIDATGRRRAWGRSWTTYSGHAHLRNAAVMRHVPRALPVRGGQVGDICIYALEGAWFWVIPLGAQMTSVGLVTSPARRGLKWEVALEECEELKALLRETATEGALTGHRDFTESAEAFVGDGWALVGDAGQFLDPVFSSGVLFALESAERLSRVINGELSPEGYETQLRDAASLIEPLILGFYSGDFLDLSLLPNEQQEPLIRAGVVSLLAGDIFDGGPRMARVVSRRLPELARRVREASGA